jgi:uncharacterized protein YuzE
LLNLNIGVEFDALADVLSVWVKDSGVSDVSVDDDPHLILETDHDGSVVGVEVLSFSSWKHPRWSNHPARKRVSPVLREALDNYFQFGKYSGLVS